jgi:biotin carboxyl carrier protein
VPGTIINHSSIRVRVGDQEFFIEKDPSHENDIHDISVCRVSENLYSILYEGRSITAVVSRTDSDRAEVTVGESRLTIDVADHRTRLLEQFGSLSDSVSQKQNTSSPMPGLVLKVLVEQDEIVEADQGLVVLEAMKMENEIRSSAAGRVARILVSTGDAVSKNAVLVEIEPLEAGS